MICACTFWLKLYNDNTHLYLIFTTETKNKKLPILDFHGTVGNYSPKYAIFFSKSAIYY